MEEKDIKILLDKYRAGTASEAEVALLESWYLHFTEQSPEVLTEEERLNTFNTVWANLEAQQAEPKIRRLWLRIAATAAAVVVLSFGAYLLVHKQAQQETAVVTKVQDILPGGNKAYLTLGNGKRISLTDAKNGTIAKEAGKTIEKTADGMLVYDDSHNNHNSAENIFNLIETPRGGQYQVVLPDGSKVWLNAASSLRYPAEFTGNDRVVELKGEGYFEVAKDKAHPFRVKTAQQTVEVLGTHFDINSYADEAKAATTLLEGSVKVTTATNEVVIKPGQQALNAAGNLKVGEANIDNVIDWKNGDFYLNRVDFRVAMRKISRWYDVEVIYDPALPDDIESGGWISRDKPLSAVLHAMEHTGQVHFKIENNKIYVTKGTSTQTK